MATFGELAKLASMKHWTLEGDRQLVKVVSAAGHDYIMRAGADRATGGGYITEKRYLWGLDNTQIERVLGLRPGELKNIAYVFDLARLPTADEVEFHYSTAFPGGESVWDGKGGVTPKYAAEKARAEKDFAAGRGSMDRSYWPVVDHYPMGSAMVPQWKLRAGVAIPLRMPPRLASPHQPFARDNGSVKPYTPHNRGPIRPV